MTDQSAPTPSERINCVSDEHMEAIERILLDVLDGEDEAMTVVQRLQADGYYLVHFPSLVAELDRMEAVARSGDRFERLLLALVMGCDRRFETRDAEPYYLARHDAVEALREAGHRV